MITFTYYDDVITDALFKNEALRKKLTSFGKENLELVYQLKQKDYELACTRNLLAVDSRVQETISTLQNENSQWKKRAENAEYKLKYYKKWYEDNRKLVTQAKHLQAAFENIQKLMNERS